MHCLPRELSILFNGRPLNYYRGYNLACYNMTRHFIVNVSFLIYAGADAPDITLHTEVLSRGPGGSPALLCFLRFSWRRGPIVGTGTCRDYCRFGATNRKKFGNQ